MSQEFTRQVVIRRKGSEIGMELMIAVPKQIQETRW